MATPPTAAVGAPIPATSWNAIVADLTDSGWITATLTNSWVAFGTPYATPSYRILNGVVYLQGFAKSGTTTVGTTIFTLPAGYRPLATIRFVVADGNTTAQFASLEVSSAGVVSDPTALGSSAGLSFNGMSFIAEQ